jgi:hypothetical protein
VLSPDERRALLEEAGSGDRRARLRAARRLAGEAPPSPAAYLAQLSSAVRVFAPFRTERPRPPRPGDTFKL